MIAFPTHFFRLFSASVLLFLTLFPFGEVLSQAPTKVLHYTETSGFDHNTRTSSLAMFEAIANNLGLSVDDDQTGEAFNSLSNLEQYAVVIFSNTSGNNILDAAQRQNFEDYIAGGGNYIGIHAATDTYRHSTANGGSTGTWDFYAEMVGASVQNGPNHVPGTPTYTMNQTEAHPLVMGLPNPWVKAEEYYYWENGYFDNSNNVVLEVEATGTNSYDAERPTTWYRELASGSHIFYTALGHSNNNFSGDAEFILLLTNAMEWTTGLESLPPNANCDCADLEDIKYSYLCLEPAIPGTLEAEFFDEGGEGLAYNDDGVRQGNNFRPSESIDIVDKSNASNAMAIGFTNQGEWAEYTVNVEAGVYQIDLSYASNSNAASDIQLALDGEEIALFESPNSTGDWNTFASVSLNDVALEGGNCKVLRLTFATNGNIDIDAITFTKTEELGCVGDMNGDGQIDASDIISFISSFGSTCSGCKEDLNGDGAVNAADLISLVSIFGSSCDGE